MPLRTKWMLVMALGVLVPSLVLGAFALYSAHAAIDAARASTEAALVAAFGARERVALDSLARRDDGTLSQLQSLSVATAAFFAHRPTFWPPILSQHSLGWLTPRSSPVGIFAPRDYVPDQASEQELAAAPYIDAFLEAQNLSPDGGARLTFVTVSGLGFVYPNLRRPPATPPDLRTVPQFFALALPGNDPNFGPVWIPPFRDPLSGQAEVAVLTPVISADGTFQGVVSVSLRLTALLQPLRILPGVPATTLLSDASGTVLAREGRIHPFDHLVSLDRLHVAPSAGPENGYRRLLGTPTFYASERLSGPPLALWAFIPGSVLAKPLAAADNRIRHAALRQLGGVAALWVLLIGGMLGLALWVADREALRIRRLAEGVRDFPKDLRRRLPAGEDELGRLGEAFNTMAQELERLTVHLEEQVLERTARLNRQKAALERLNALGRRLMQLRSRQEIFEAARRYLAELGYPDPAFHGAGTRPDHAVPVLEGRLYLATASDDPLGILPAVAAEVAAALENLRRFALEEERREEARREAVVAERHRLAREIHDTLAQAFLGILLHSRAVSAGDDTSVHHLDRVQELAKKGLEEARRSVWNLSPKVLEGRSTKTVLEDAVARWVDLWGITAETEIEDVSVPPETTVALLRILEEALENVRKHALATRVRVRLFRRQDRICLEVADNGRGFSAGGAGHGLRFMAERAQALGGDVEIRSEGGTVVFAHLPEGE